MEGGGRRTLVRVTIITHTHIIWVWIGDWEGDGGDRSGVERREGGGGRRLTELLEPKPKQRTFYQSQKQGNYIMAIKTSLNK